MLLIPEDPNAVLIMAATGTGIAPFRSFWRRLFFENTPDYKVWAAWAWRKVLALCVRSCVTSE